MDFHPHKRSEDGAMWMHGDDYAFRNIKERWPVFKEEPHNVRLSMTTHGVHLFGDLRSI
jgi:hypothetical protein